MKHVHHACDEIKFEKVRIRIYGIKNGLSVARQMFCDDMEQDIKYLFDGNGLSVARRAIFYDITYLLDVNGLYVAYRAIFDDIKDLLGVNGLSVASRAVCDDVD